MIGTACRKPHPPCPEFGSGACSGRVRNVAIDDGSTEGRQMIRLVINGQAHALDVEPDTPLLWVLRDHLKLFGTRYGCGAALCGCCTVHVDGQARRACVVPVNEVEGQAITTIEGLGNGALHPLQAAWLEVDVAQCGYCQSGQIMQAAALLSVIPKPSDRDIDEAMSGNLCRCGTYQRVRQAIKLAAFGPGRETPR
ncbi:(2Fe-2S)-binding protein [Lysobacter sp. CA199]|uniref:(2Fe-2S)-binding protein n=1 Tax=Lysobacter sp. CA199 TaxID=3455608 RepID=UPI003F8D36BA